MGTPSYMAPEQASGDLKEIGAVSDVYSLGAILYELLTARPPFQGETLIDTLIMVRFEEPVPPIRLQPKVPPDLETICLKCLEKEGRKRYARAGDLADDLDRFLTGKPIQARRAGLAEKLWKWTRREPWKAGAYGAGALIALLVVAIAGSTYLH